MTRGDAGSTSPVIPQPRSFLAGLALIAAAAVVFWPALRAPFVFDDVPSIVENRSIERLWPPRVPLRPPGTANAVAGRPIANLSLALSYSLGGRDVRGFHLASIVLHALSAVLLFSFVRHALAGRWPDVPARALAFALALVWTVHPLQTEPVAYAVQRTELLFGACLLLTLVAAQRAWTGGRGWEALAVGACALGMASKETMVAAPLLVVVYDAVVVGGSWRFLWSRRRRLYLALAGTWLILAGLLASGEQWSVATRRTGGPTPGGYLFAQAPVIVHYLRLAAWPSGLRLVYDWPASRALADVLVPGAVVVALLCAGVIALWRRHWLALPAACFFLVLAPTSSVIPLPTEAVAERRMYVPLAAVLAVVAGAVVAIERARGARRPGRVAAGLLLAAALPLAVASRQRLRAWESDVTLWADAAAKSPGSAFAHYNLANALNRRGRPQDALPEYAAAYRVDPAHWEAHFNRGVMLVRLQRYDEAAEEFRATLALRPGHAPTHLNLGTYLVRQGRREEARREYEAALKLDPDYALARRALAELERPPVR